MCNLAHWLAYIFSVNNNMLLVRVCSPIEENDAIQRTGCGNLHIIRTHANTLVK
jgi:hypothetical protein